MYRQAFLAPLAGMYRYVSGGGSGHAFHGSQVAGVKEQPKIFRVVEMGDLLGHNVKAGEQNRGGQLQMKHPRLTGLGGAPDALAIRGVSIE